MMTQRFGIAIALLAFGLSGCGYTLQTSKSPLVEREKIETVYVEPATNATLRMGVENVVYNALIRNLSVHKTLRMVSKPEYADSILRSNIDTLSVGSAGVTPGENLLGVPQYSKYYAGIPFTTYYSATLQCSFTLLKRLRGAKLGAKSDETTTLWGSTFARTKTYPTFLRTGPEGTTSPLITDSELDRVLGEIVTSIMDDVHENMLNSF